jgi:hypothetical protein
MKKTLSFMRSTGAFGHGICGFVPKLLILLAVLIFCTAGMLHAFGPMRTAVQSGGDTTAVSRADSVPFRRTADTSLKGITVNGVEIPNFEPSILYYTVVVPNSTTFATVVGRKSDQSFEILEKALAVGNNLFQLVISAMGEVSREYRVIVKRQSAEVGFRRVEVIAENILYTDSLKQPISVGFFAEVIKISAVTTNDANATVLGLGTYPFPAEEFLHDYTITVIAEDTSCKRDYTIQVRRMNAITFYSGAFIAGDKAVSLDPLQEEHFFTVENMIDSVRIMADAEDERASVSGATGWQTIPVGDTVFIVSIIAEDTSVRRDIRVNVRRLSSDPTMSALLVNGKPAQGLRPDIFEFVEAVRSDVEQVVFQAIVDSGTTVMITGPDSLTVGDNEYVFTILSGDKINSVIYRVTIRRLSGDATLSAFMANGTLVEWLNPDSAEYNMYGVPYGTDSVELEGVPSHSAALVTITGPDLLTVEDNEYVFTVRAEDAQVQKVYTLNVRWKSADALLKGLSVSDILHPALFSPGTFDYELGSVPYEKSSILIETETQDSTATVVGDGEIRLAVGDTAIKVTVFAEDTAFVNIYTLYIRRKNNDARLQTLRVVNRVISPVFNADIVDYTVFVPEGENSIEITAMPSHAAATVTGTGKYSLPGGKDTRIVINTVAEDNAFAKSYSLTVTRQMSRDARLQSLSVAGRTISPVFNADIVDYTVFVPEGENSIRIAATPLHAAATVTGRGNFTAGAAGVFSITVTAEDRQSKQTYTVRVMRQKSADATLGSLSVTPCTGLWAADDVGEDYYWVGITNDMDSITITAIPTHAAATVTGTGKFAVAIWSEEPTFYVTVTAEDGTTGRDYALMVIRRSAGEEAVVAAPAVRVYYHGRDLYIDSPVAEQVFIYSVTGVLLGKHRKAAGVSSAGSPTGRVLIVKGSSGWVRKLGTKNQVSRPQKS